MPRARNAPDESARGAAKDVLARLEALEAEALDALDDADEGIRRAAGLALTVGAEARYYVLHSGDVAVAVAIAAALDAGLLWGVLRRRYHIRAAETLRLLELYPDVEASRGQRRGARRGGAQSRKVTPEVLAELEKTLTRLHAKRPHLSYGKLCSLAGQQQNPTVGQRTVENALRGGPADWRRKEKR
jgi:hypothetical protein